MTLPVRRDGPPPEFATFRPPQPAAIDEQERKRFYWRAAWKRCRALKLARDPLCEECLRLGLARPEPASQVHHKIDLAERRDLAYDLDNLESLCQTHHSRETMSRNLRRGAVGAGSPRNP